MPKGTVAKTIISKKILDTFEGAFPYNDGKEIRIPIEEDGEIITKTRIVERSIPLNQVLANNKNTITIQHSYCLFKFNAFLVA